MQNKQKNETTSMLYLFFMQRQLNIEDKKHNFFAIYNTIRYNNTIKIDAFTLFTMITHAEHKKNTTTFYILTPCVCFYKRTNPRSVSSKC